MTLNANVDIRQFFPPFFRVNEENPRFGFISEGNTKLGKAVGFVLWVREAVEIFLRAYETDFVNPENSLKFLFVLAAAFSD